MALVKMRVEVDDVLDDAERKRSVESLCGQRERRIQIGSQRIKGGQGSQRVTQGLHPQVAVVEPRDPRPLRSEGRAVAAVSHAHVQDREALHRERVTSTQFGDEAEPTVEAAAAPGSLGFAWRCRFEGGVVRVAVTQGVVHASVPSGVFAGRTG